MIRIVEVGPRDGLQNEKTNLSVKDKLEFVHRLSDAGLRDIEVGAFVSPKWIPQMADTERLCFELKRSGKKNKNYSVLVPNVFGMNQAIKSGVKEVSIFAACSETFSQRNINCSIKESFKRFEEVIQLAKSKKIKVRGYLSTVFGCPYEGKMSPHKVVRLTEKFLELGVYEVSLGDTIGVATPYQVRSVLRSLHKSLGPQFTKKTAMHFHDTRGTALANVLVSLDFGIKTFDSSVGGLGGCPYAIGASGNLPTEDLVYMLHGMKLKTGVRLDKLIQVSQWIENKIGRTLPAHLTKSGDFKLF